ncbi:replication protein A 70 kDa DNA-binding subunit-like [Trifolium pratense]|uniref:replication protein A 70 kDa DNA-binding subunit-like n=1 Tax=Trifolium pratense TaxID=57577 RepID=UPI001E6962F1|nr:replication protein A 70 kDa DNA-binding subunit-like [Trifolium pratense]
MRDFSLCLRSTVDRCEAMRAGRRGHLRVEDLSANSPQSNPGRDSWRFKVRVLRLWSVSAFLRPDQVNSLEMVLIDEKGAKIHASIRRQLLYLFNGKIVEGSVYKMSFFVVYPESGLYRTTSHRYKLSFEMKTKVQICESGVIDRYGLSLTSIGDICAYGPDHDFLVDVVALITGISPEKEYVRDGKVTKMVVIELSDNSGKCECALFGGYVQELQEMLAKCADGLPIVVVQFAKIKMFGGKVSIQNVLNATRIYVNPPIPEVVSFKQVMPLEGVESCVSIPAIGERVKPSFEEDFLLNYPKTSIAHLLELAEDGIYVVSGVVGGLLEGEDWWYASCKCHKGLSADSGAYYCKKCDKHVFKMVPRFRVKLVVNDGTAEGVFVVFDGDMSSLVGKCCPDLVAAAKARNRDYCPPELDLLKGKRLLFKVEKVSYGVPRFDGSFRVKRICSNLSIVKAFDASMAEDDSGEHGYDLEVDYVDNTPVEDVVGNLIVSPTDVKVKHGIDLSTAQLVPEIINLDDNSDNGFEVFLGERVGVDVSKVLAAKRNLSDAFAGCDDDEASSSKRIKYSPQ